MQRPWLFKCVLVVTSLVLGCNQAKVPPTAAVSAPMPSASQAATMEPAVVLERKQLASDGPKVRLHLTVVEFHPNAPFPDELPDLWGRSESSKVFLTDEILAAIDRARLAGAARCRTLQDIDVASGDAGNWSGLGDADDGVIITPRIRPDEPVQLSVVSPKDASGNDTTGPTNIKLELRGNQTMVVAGPTLTVHATEISRVPFWGDLPFIGPRFFTTRKTTTETNRSMYLISCEVVPR